MDPNSFISLGASGNALTVPGLRNQAVSLSTRDSSAALLRPSVLCTHTPNCRGTPVFLPFFLSFPFLFQLEHRQSLCQDLSADITQSQGVMHTSCYHHPLRTYTAYRSRNIQNTELSLPLSLWVSPTAAESNNYYQAVEK